MKGLLCVLLALPAGKYSLLCTLRFVSLHHWCSSAVTVHFVCCVVKPFVFFCSYCALCVLCRQTICLLVCSYCVVKPFVFFCSYCVVKPFVFFCSYCVVKPFVFFCSYCALSVLCRQTIRLLLQLLCTLCFVSVTVTSDK